MMTAFATWGQCIPSPVQVSLLSKNSAQLCHVGCICEAYKVCGAPQTWRLGGIQPEEHCWRAVTRACSRRCSIEHQQADSSQSVRLTGTGAGAGSPSTLPDLQGRQRLP